MSCFICVQQIDSSQSQIKSWLSMKSLLVTTCKLMEIPDITQEDWKLMERTSKVTSMCCSSCFNCLCSIKTTYDILQETQDRLKQYVEKLETTVKKSTIRNVDSSLWSPGLVKFRNQVTRRLANNQKRAETKTSLAYCQKLDLLEEEEIPYFNGESFAVDSREVVGKKMKAAFNNLMKYQNIPDSSIHSDNDWDAAWSDTVTVTKPRRKRRIVVIAEEDEPVTDTNNLGKRGRRSFREIRKPQVLDKTSSGNDSDDDPDFDPCEEEPSKCSYQPGIPVFTPSNGPEKWFVCGVNGCETEWNSSKYWKRHGIKEHPGVDLGQVWKEMPRRKIAPRRNLHCGHSKCKTSFLTRYGLRNHMKAVHPVPVKPRPEQQPTNLRKCDICPEMIPKTGEVMVQHVRDHVGDYALKCINPDCEFLFSTIGSLKYHASHRKTCLPFLSSANLETCEICGFKERNLETLGHHLTVAHETGDSKFYLCPVADCTEKFSYRQSVLFHISKRHGATQNRKLLAPLNSQPCPECSKSFPVDEIPNHFIRSHNAPWDSILSCNHCPFKAFKRSTLLDHLYVHFKQGVSIPCDICPHSPETTFSRLADLRLHLVQTHQIGESFICEHCSRLFTVELHLKRHIEKLHSGNKVEQPSKGKKLACDLCNENEANPVKYNQGDLMTHKILVHGAEPYKCSLCPETFVSWKMFVVHKNAHKNVARRKYPCDIPGCGAVCISPAELRIHKNSIMHVGRTNAFVCDKCGAGFNNKTGLQCHLRITHAKEKKFVCDVCGTKFPDRAGLKRHYNKHTGVKPYECTICSQRFSLSHHLKSHMKSHEGERQPKFPRVKYSM